MPSFVVINNKIVVYNAKYCVHTKTHLYCGKSIASPTTNAKIWSNNPKTENRFHSNGITWRYRFTNCVSTWEASFSTFSKCDEENLFTCQDIDIMCGDDNLPNYFSYFFSSLPLLHSMRLFYFLSYPQEIHSVPVFVMLWCFNSYWNILHLNNNNFMPTSHILCVSHISKKVQTK